MTEINEFVWQQLERLRAAVRRSKIFKFHMDTCDCMLIEGYPCNCGHTELRELLDDD